MTGLEQNLLYLLAIVTLLGGLTVTIWQVWRQLGPGRRRDDDPTDGPGDRSDDPDGR